MAFVGRRRYLQLAAGAGVSLSGVLMAACGGSGGAGNGGVTLAAKKVRTGTLLTWRSYINNEPLLAEINKIWSAKHPDIKLTHAFSTAAEIAQKLTGEIAAGTPVDVAMSSYRDVPSFQRYLTNMEPYARDKYALSDFVPAAINQYRLGNGLYALPNSFPVRVGMYNATLFAERGVKPPPSTWDAPGWSFDDFVTAMKGVTQIKGDQTIWGMGWDKAVPLPNLIQVMLFCNNNGGSVMSEDGKECLLTQPRSREALQYMQDLIQRHRVAPAPGDVPQAGADLFAQGKVAWASFGPASVAAYRKSITFDWGLTTVPLGPGAKQRTTVMDGSAWMMMDAPNKEEAWELAQTLVSPEEERAAGQLQGYVPARKALMAEYATGEPPKNFKLLAEASERTYLVPKTPWMAEADMALAPLLAELWAGKKSANVVAEDGKRVLDPILKKEFTFKTG